MSDEIPRKLELGCGTEKPNGYFGVDIVDTDTVDLVQDLDKAPWDLESDYFQVIRAIDVFEHLNNPVQFMEEVHRIAASEAEIIIQGPHISSDNWHDPTHKRLLSSRTFEHFTSETRFSFYSDARFRIQDYKITFEWTSLPIYRHLGGFISNNFTDLYEKYLFKNIFPATNIVFHLEVVK